jgi:HEAT repeat protein
MIKLLTLSLLTAAAFSLPVGAPAVSPDPLPAASWAPRDTADSLWRRGRIAIADESWREAARTFERLVLNHPKSTYAGDALYWQAFALQRFGGTNEVRDAVRALERQKEEYPQSATYTSGESAALMTRLNGRLARSGDSEAAMAIAEIATSVAAFGATVAAEVVPAINAEVARAMPEIQAEVAREMAAASREMSAATREAARTSYLRSSRNGRSSDIPPGCEDVVTDERIEALNALLQMNADQALPILKRVLERRDRCSEVLRRKAVFLVSQKRSEEAVDILVNTAKTDPDATTRSEAVFWLSQTRSERAVSVLEDILVKDAPDEDVQKRAVFALSQTRSPRASEILRDFVVRRDVSTELRGEAIFWLGQTRGGDNSRFLRDLFPRLESDVLRDKAIFAVAQQKSPENSRWLLQQAKDRRHSAEIRKAALFWGGQAGASAKDLGDIYDTSRDDTELRGQVIFALSQRRNDAAAVDKLVDIARKEEDKELRRQALFWLGQTKDPRAAQILEEIINKPL